MANTILLVFEGEKTEVQIYENLKQSFFMEESHTIVSAVYRGEIYQLFSKLKDDPYLDIVELLKERDNKILHNIARDDISQIFLFFDYDGHATDATDEKIEKMLLLFKEETEHGKLYLSYPMVEAVKDFNKNDEDFKDYAVLVSDGATYKNEVHKRTRFQNIRTITKDDWFYILEHSIKKAHYLVESLYLMPDYQGFRTHSQSVIFSKQQDIFIKPFSKISVLSGFPFFVLEYFGERLFNEVNRLRSIT